MAPTDGQSGFQCAAGTFCPQGTLFVHECTPGDFCRTSGLSNATGKVEAGFYAWGGAILSNVSDGVTGAICPQGHFCLEGNHVLMLARLKKNNSHDLFCVFISGSSTPSRCPIGTFNNAVGGPSATSCMDCTAGYYCNQTALVAEEGQCPQGFWCESKTIVPYRVCPAGSMCPTGSAKPILCPHGTYQDQSGQWTCKDCPSGHHCIGTGNTNYTLCGPGSYCPQNTKFSTEFLCPNGTFSNISGLVSEANCTLCPPTMYCEGIGNTEPSGKRV